MACHRPIYGITKGSYPFYSVVVRRGSSHFILHSTDGKLETTSMLKEIQQAMSEY